MLSIKLTQDEKEFIGVALEHWFASSQELAEAVSEDNSLTPIEKRDQLNLLDMQAGWGASILLKIGKEPPPWETEA